MTAHEGRVQATLLATPGGFLSHPVEALELALDGVCGDHHAGWTRRSGGREPWYPRRTVIRNDRQVSLVSAEEMALVAAQMGLEAIDPCAIGANLVIAGLDAFTATPRGARLVFPSGAVIVVTDENHPCRRSGRALAALHPERADVEPGFVKRARGLRGLVGAVERPGLVLRGDGVTLRLPR